MDRLHKFDEDGKMIPADRYDIYHRPHGSKTVEEHRKVSEAKTRNGARGAVDRRDNAYGAYAHYAVPVYEPKKPKDT